MHSGMGPEPEMVSFPWLLPRFCHPPSERARRQIRQRDIMKTLISDVVCLPRWTLPSWQLLLCCQHCIAGVRSVLYGAGRAQDMDQWRSLVARRLPCRSLGKPLGDQQEAAGRTSLLCCGIGPLVVSRKRSSEERKGRSGASLTSKYRLAHAD